MHQNFLSSYTLFCLFKYCHFLPFALMVSISMSSTYPVPMSQTSPLPSLLPLQGLLNTCTPHPTPSHLPTPPMLSISPPLLSHLTPAVLPFSSCFSEPYLHITSFSLFMQISPSTLYSLDPSSLKTVRSSSIHLCQTPLVP